MDRLTAHRKSKLLVAAFLRLDFEPEEYLQKKFRFPLTQWFRLH